jgi:hypothetical protein
VSIIGHLLHDVLFPKKDGPDAERQAWREAIHESRNVAAISVATARKSKKASDEALRSAQCAIKLLERSRETPEK